MNRDHRGENQVAFSAREHSAMTGKPTCKHYGKYDHEEENCYEIVGYPTGWSSRGEPDQGGKTTAGKGRGSG